MLPEASCTCFKKFQCNENTTIFIHENDFENVIFEITTILSKCVKHEIKTYNKAVCIFHMI